MTVLKRVNEIIVESYDRGVRSSFDDKNRVNYFVPRIRGMLANIRDLFITFTCIRERFYRGLGIN